VVRDRWRERPGGGVWQDLGPHLIDQALVLFGRPLGITCDLAIQRDGGLSRTGPMRRCATPTAVSGSSCNAAMLIAAPDVRFAVHGAKASWLKSGLDVQEDQLKAGMASGAPGWGVDPPRRRSSTADRRTHGRPRPAGDYPAYYAAVAAALRGQGPNPSRRRRRWRSWRCWRPV
jgi:predicted dehydrogenase